MCCSLTKHFIFFNCLFLFYFKLLTKDTGINKTRKTIVKHFKFVLYTLLEMYWHLKTFFIKNPKCNKIVKFLLEYSWTSLPQSVECKTTYPESQRHLYRLQHVASKVLSVPEYTANLYCICLSMDVQYT